MLINNRYRVIRPLGEGGFGHAYLAEDTQMPSKRKCVIKQLKPITTSPEVYQVVQDRFQREAAILEQLGDNHSQIPRLYAYFSESQKFYLVQEWIEGETLEEVTVPQSEAAVTDILMSLLPVLDFIHQQGIIHRDLKPENIILRTDTGPLSGQPVLIDFGAVRETMGTVMNSRNHPTSSIVIGTPGYMSAEQAAGRPIPSSDLYSLGLTAIYLLTGQMPQALQSNPQTGELVWQQSAGHVSPALRAVLDRAVQSHPRDRYTTASQMLQALSALPGVADALPQADLPKTVLPQNPFPSAVSPAAPPATQSPIAAPVAASELKTMVVAATPTQQQSPQTSPQASANTVLTGDSLLSGSAANSSRPWFRKLTPLTMGLSVIWIGGGAIALGLFISQRSVDTSIQPISSSRPNNPTEKVADSQPTSQDADDVVNQQTGEENADDEQTDSKPIEPIEPIEPQVPPVDNTPDPPTLIEIPLQEPVVLSAPDRQQIDVYEQPSFAARSPSYGVNGDFVIATARTEPGPDGIWYKVRFDSGTEGWVPESVVRSGVGVAPTPPVDPGQPRDLDTVPKYTELLGSSGERINVRSGPSTSADSPHFGLAGDPVQILSNARGPQGYDWYRVAFESGAEGWVREDLILLP
ncbi:MAG: protein kinase [Phormidesmis sp.]